jgi:hypothetical protein
MCKPVPEIPTVFPIPTATQEKDQKSRDWLALFVLILVAVLFFVLSQVDPDLRRSSLWGTIGSSAALAATIYWLFQKRADQRFTEKAEQMIARSAEMTEELLMDSDVLDSALERITKDKSFGCGLAAIAKGYRNARVCRDLRWDLVVANEDATYFRIRGRVTYKRLLKPRTLTIMCTESNIHSHEYDIEDERHEFVWVFQGGAVSESDFTLGVFQLRPGGNNSDSGLFQELPVSKFWNLANCLNYSLLTRPGVLWSSYTSS